MESHKIHVPNHQPAILLLRVKKLAHVFKGKHDQSVAFVGPEVVTHAPRPIS